MPGQKRILVAGAEVEPGPAAGTRHGAGRRSALLLRAVNRREWTAAARGRSLRRRPCSRSLPVHGRTDGGSSDGCEDVPGRGARGAHVAPVQAGLRVEGVAGGWVRKARVGPTGHRPPLRPLLQGPLV